MAARKKGLGKGLDALLGGAFNTAAGAASKSSAGQQHASPAGDTAQPAGLAARLQTVDDLQQAQARSEQAASNSDATPGTEQVLQIPVEQCQRGRYQPRRVIDDDSLEELAASIRSQGVMQPITLRPLQGESDSGARYEIIAGERRWRAAQLAGLDSVPAIVRDLSDEAAIALALIENLQRDDLNPMEEAYALQRLQQEFDLTHQQIADTLGKSRAAVSNSLRLTNLVMDVKLMLENGDLEMGHARALLAVPDKRQGAIAREVVDRALTVRQTEVLVKQLLEPAPKPVKSGATQDPNITQLQNDLADRLGVPVALKHKGNGAGQLVLKYNSLDELDGILSHIK